MARDSISGTRCRRCRSRESREAAGTTQAFVDADRGDRKRNVERSEDRTSHRRRCTPLSRHCEQVFIDSQASLPMPERGHLRSKVVIFRQHSDDDDGPRLRKDVLKGNGR